VVESDARDRYLRRLDRRINDYLRRVDIEAGRVWLAEHDTPKE
jgi:hypothetical protein